MAERLSLSFIRMNGQIQYPKLVPLKEKFMCLHFTVGRIRQQMSGEQIHSCLKYVLNNAVTKVSYV